MLSFCFTGKENNFEKAAPETTDGQGVPYDYGSVMHYSAKAFSTNGQPTIVAKVCVKNELLFYFSEDACKFYYVVY